MKKITTIAILLFALMPVISMAEKNADLNVMLKKFSTNRHDLVNNLIEELNIQKPVGLWTFFDAAKSGDWISVSNNFKAFQNTDVRSTGIRPEMRNELWSPALETLGIYEVVEDWKKDSSLLAMFYEPIISSIPVNSIYFGGTDHGRFLITAMTTVNPKPEFFCITQNALADNTYMAHLNAVYGEELWIPDLKESASAFQQYINEVNSGQRPRNADINIDNGRVQVSGALGVMEINGILCEKIFTHNKDNYEFFIEESYVINWMYPYLEPHGLIMKLNKERIPRLSETTIRKDMEFWKKHIAALLKNPGFKANPNAQKAFAKLRCAIGGIYVSRGRYEQAETCFKQALTLCSSSPETHFRYAKMHEQRGNIKKALKLMNSYVAIASKTTNIHAESKSRHSLDKAKKYILSLQNHVE